METKPDKQENAGIRDEKGRFVPGVSGNPNGRTKGVSITEAIREELMKYPVDSKQTFLQAIVNKIFVKAINDGDVTMLKAIWNYIDGMPKQATDITTGGEPLSKVIVEFINGVKDAGDNSPSKDN